MKRYVKLTTGEIIDTTSNNYIIIDGKLKLKSGKVIYNIGVVVSESNEKKELEK